jgi:hypothetical protein
MTGKLEKMITALLLGFFLIAQPVVAMSPLTAAGGSVHAKACCGHCGRCHAKACCVKPNAPATPVTADSVIPISQNEWQALAVFAVAWMTLPALPASQDFLHFSAPVSLTVVPLFQRDCCYLI